MYRELECNLRTECKQVNQRKSDLQGRYFSGKILDGAARCHSLCHYQQCPAAQGRRKKGYRGAISHLLIFWHEYKYLFHHNVLDFYLSPL